MPQWGTAAAEQVAKDKPDTGCFTARSGKTGEQQMGTVIVRMRVLAEAPSRVWIAVSGIIGPATQHHIRQRLHHHAAAGTSAFYLDLRESRCTEGMTREDIRAVFDACPDADLHLIGAPDDILDVFRNDPRFTVHPAWSPRGTSGPRASGARISAPVAGPRRRPCRRRRY